MDLVQCIPNNSQQVDFNAGYTIGNYSTRKYCYHKNLLLKEHGRAVDIIKHCEKRLPFLQKDVF